MIGAKRFDILFNMAIILHVDMDAFFASVEQLHHPAWRGRPVVVGSGPHERGVVSTCSYEARRYGIHSAMPSRTAYELCPHAIFTPLDMALYKAVSDRAFEVFSHYSPYVEAVSIDEAFLDITGTVHLHGSPRALGEALRAEVKRTCGVTCSVGIAPNRLLAKIGSEEHKPDGLTLLPVEPAAIAAFLAPKPLQTIWGVGRKTVALLKRHGLVTCGDVQRLDPRTLATILKSPVLATALYEHAYGRASDVVAREDADEKSVSREHTFGEDVAERAAVRERLLELVGEVGRRFRRARRWARTARLKLRDDTFETVTRQLPFDVPSRDDMAFRAAAIRLFDAVWPETAGTRRPVRLIGFGVTNIQPTPGGAPSLFPSPEALRREKNERLSSALDSLHEKGLLR